LYRLRTAFSTGAAPADYCLCTAFVLLSTGAAPADYCLVPGAGDDLDFFCSDWSNELLVAAGVRNDSGDYFKV
jgi:hypothetical protein